MRSKEDCKTSRGPSRKDQCNTCDLINRRWGGGHPCRRRRKTERLYWVLSPDPLCCHWGWGWGREERRECGTQE